MINKESIKELEIEACKVFVCPNISSIEKLGKELKLSDNTIKRAKDMAIEYLKMTYHIPEYASIKHVIPSFMHLASILEHEKRSMKIISEKSFCSPISIRKWDRKIMDRLGIKEEYTDAIEYIKKRPIKKDTLEKIKRKRRIKVNLMDSAEIKEYVDKMNVLIEEKCRELFLDKDMDKDVLYDIADIAKDYANRYLEKTNNKDIKNYTQIVGGAIYLSSLLEGEPKTQLEIASVLDVPEPYVGLMYNKLLKNFRMKILFGINKKVIKVIIDDDE